MTPRSLEPDTVHAKLRLMRGLLDDLDEVAPLTVDMLTRRRMTRHAIERILTQLVDLAVGVNGHVAASQLGRSPADYRDSFRLAARAGALSEDLAARLMPSVGLRNVLTHEYVDVDLSVVTAAVDMARKDYRSYLSAVASYLLGAVETATGEDELR